MYWVASLSGTVGLRCLGFWMVFVAFLVPRARPQNGAAVSGSIEACFSLAGWSGARPRLAPLCLCCCRLRRTLLGIADDRMS